MFASSHISIEVSRSFVRSYVRFLGPAGGDAFPFWVVFVYDDDARVSFALVKREIE